MRCFRVLFLSMSAALCVAAPAVWAQEDAECLLCHGEPDLSKTLPDGRVVPLYVDAEVYATSVHAENGCVTCHADITELPHAPELARVQCGLCHDVSEEYEQSLHGQALSNGDEDAAACGDCHGEHDIRRATDPLSSTHPTHLPQTCGRCHADSELVKRRMISQQNPMAGYLKSTHAELIFSEGRTDAASCNDCHGTHDMQPAHKSESRVNRYNVPETCGQCHPDEQAEFEQSIHGAALRAGIQDAPNCTDCHGEHDIEEPGQSTSSVNKHMVSRSTCPRCHDDERIMTKYGVEIMRQASYMDSYHGMASASGSEVVASCTSCHGVHNILPQSDPDSSINLANLPQTCGKCHAEANPNFAVGAVHIIPTDPGQKALGIVRLLYIVLIVAIIGGMVAHNTLMMARHAFSKFHEELGEEGTYRRFNLGQTVGHMILTISFIALTVSGFALRYPDAWWSQHLFVGPTGLAMRGIVHRISAVVLVALSVVNLIYLVGTRGGRKELRSLLFSWQDLKDLFHNLAYGLGLRKAHPPYGRYNYIEKAEYWGMWWGTVLMIITGFCMWFVNWFLAYFPKIALDVVALIHFYEAWLAMLTIIIWHLYYMIFDPETYPMNWSWITGRITQEDFKIRHPLEYEQVAVEDGGGAAGGAEAGKE